MKILIYFTEFGNCIGGGEILPLSLIAALQESNEIVLALAKKSELCGQPERYGIKCDLSKVKVEVLSPLSLWDRTLDRVFHHYRGYRLKQLAAKCDICISAANMVDFGKPGIHFVYMMIFDEAFRAYARHESPPVLSKGRLGLLRHALQGVGQLFLGRTRAVAEIIRDPREKVFANSRYVKSLMEDYYQCKLQPVFYPPTLFSPVQEDNVERNGVAYVGRIEPEKKIVELIKIVEKARELSNSNLTLDIAGVLSNASYEVQIRAFITSRTWVNLVGPVVDKEKAEFLGRHKYAVHTRRDEEFGISVTEYLKAGLVCIVPNEGGAMEVVSQERLTYVSEKDAATKLSRLVCDRDYYLEMLDCCMRRGEYFSRVNYLSRERGLLQKLVV